jgi:Transposase IS116/IS110/IS902 family
LIGRLPESWIAPAHLLDLRARVRCRHTLVHQRTEWQQRMQAVLFHHGTPHSRKLLTLANRERIAALKLPDAAGEQLTIALQMIDAIDVQLGPFDLSLRAYARRQTGCRALIEEIYGVGELTAVTILAELGDPRRFQNSRDAVRYGGLDITIRESDQRRALGHLSRQGPPALRWALYEAAQAARRPGSPDRAYYQQLAERIGSNRACIAISRKSSNAATTSSARSATRPSRHLNALNRHAASPNQPMNRGQLPKPCCRPRPAGKPRKIERPQPICRNNRGRDARCQAPPAQIPACASTHWAPPSGLGVEAHGGPGVKDAGLG